MPLPFATDSITAATPEKSEDDPVVQRRMHNLKVFLVFFTIVAIAWFSYVIYRLSPTQTLPRDIAAYLEQPDLDALYDLDSTAVHAGGQTLDYYRSTWPALYAKIPAIDLDTVIRYRNSGLGLYVEARVLEDAAAVYAGKAPASPVNLTRLALAASRMAYWVPPQSTTVIQYCNTVWQAQLASTDALQSCARTLSETYTRLQDFDNAVLWSYRYTNDLPSDLLEQVTKTYTPEKVLRLEKLANDSKVLVVPNGSGVETAVVATGVDSVKPK